MKARARLSTAALLVAGLAGGMLAATAPSAAGAASPLTIDSRASSAPSRLGGGTRLWLARYNGTGAGYATSVVASPDGARVFVAGAATVAYAAATGAQLWAVPTGPSPYAPWSAAVSPDGSKVFVAGGSRDANGRLRYVTVAFDSATGARLWKAVYHGPGARDDRPHAIAVSPDGSMVFVTGQSSNSTNPTALSNAYATVAYAAADGTPLWVARYSAGTDAAANAVATSPDGSRVYVTGASAGPAGRYSYATIAYSAATGSVAWVERYSQDRRNAAASSIAVSPDGSALYVTGAARTSQGGQKITTVAYGTSGGSTRWVAQSSGPSGATAMAISKDGTELAVTGQGKTNTGYYAYATLAYRTATGAQLWTRHYAGPNGFGLGVAVAMSPDGSKVFVTGYVGTGTVSFYGTVAYAAVTGNLLWRKLYKGPVPGDDQATAIAVSPDGTKVFVTGGSPGPTGTAIATLAYQS